MAARERSVQPYRSTSQLVVGFVERRTSYDAPAKLRQRLSAKVTEFLFIKVMENVPKRFSRGRLPTTCEPKTRPCTSESVGRLSTVDSTQSVKWFDFLDKAATKTGHNTNQEP